MSKTLPVAQPAVASAGASAGSGIWLGIAGMLCFSLTLPATKLAVTSVDALIVGLGRSLVALPFALVALLLSRGGLPPRSAMTRLPIVVAGNIFGFPVFSALAVHYSSAAHAAVIFGTMPFATALAGALRARERMSPRFWLFSAAGAAVTALFSFDSQRSGGIGLGDLYACIAVALGSLGYAEGALLARQFGPMRVQAWALVLGAPPVAVLVAWLAATRGLHPDLKACAGLLYIGAFSSFLGFIPWNAGLARGGVARVGQILLLQPICTIAWSFLLLHESVNDKTLLSAVAVCLCATLAIRARHKASGAH
ncbi:DMT family transporter [Burkholderia sp. BCC0405]|uniref:DMT family transporter n=1 Tax=Burkholderia sp. BCC0405 TaxID=2676298 RepID=UPI00158EDB8D|nr:DMT family transporter [Burkholderia sp. BCC0405]